MKLDETLAQTGGGTTISAARLRDAENRRFLHQMPLFQPVEPMPERFEQLLARLEAVERGSRASRDG